MIFTRNRRLLKVLKEMMTNRSWNFQNICEANKRHFSAQVFRQIGFFAKPKSTNEPFDLPVNASFDLVVQFGNEYNNDNEAILIIPHAEYEINVAHHIYELIILSLPQKRIHPGVEDGTLDSELLERLETLSPKSLENKPQQEDIDPRWDTLKKLLTDK